MPESRSSPSADQTDALRSQYDAPQPRRRWQFSLRGMIICVFALSVAFAIATRFPRQSGFGVLMMLLLLVPLVVAATLRVPLIRLGLIADDRLRPVTSARHGPIFNSLIRPLRLLGLWRFETEPSLVGGFMTAIISTITVVGLWPAVREVGLLLALTSIQSVGETWEYGLRSVPEAFSSGRYWLRLWEWEIWSVGRWWLLFGAILLVWIAVSSLLHRRLKGDRASNTLARFLSFAPWFIVLEVAFLVGVWIESPNTVPEPSTGFVVGIFSWDLWHWDCWLNRGWLIRGALPTFVAGGVFFKGVLRWRWPAAVAAAILLVPIALMLSVACTVAFQNGLP